GGIGVDGFHGFSSQKEMELPKAFPTGRVAAMYGVGNRDLRAPLDHAEACPYMAAAADLTDAVERPQTRQ
ncbi:hypothetical protein, partial [Pseudomonas sp. KK4]|uniref:hypothetical protein n=1 Tax=Pseudomonas sp. KK4 TaxID=1855729 RepID=UPI001C437D61